VAPRFPLARGWLRQQESDDFDPFTDGRLTPLAYRSWLFERGVSYVALPDAELDYLAEDEARLIRAGLPYLRPLWANRDWRLYGVAGTPGLVSPAADRSRPARPRARLEALGPAGFTLRARSPGPYLVRVRWTPYWKVGSGDACVASSGDWTLVETPARGRVEVSARLGIAGLLGGERRCSG
jgi:hypothetical protein